MKVSGILSSLVRGEYFWQEINQDQVSFAIIYTLHGLLLICCAVLCLVTQLCPILCNSRDCSPPGSSVHGDSPGKNTGVGCHALLQGIFPNQGLNPGLPHCRWILYQLTYQGSPINMLILPKYIIYAYIYII